MYDYQDYLKSTKIFLRDRLINKIRIDTRSSGQAAGFENTLIAQPKEDKIIGSLSRGGGLKDRLNLVAFKTIVSALIETVGKAVSRLNVVKG